MKQFAPLTEAPEPGGFRIQKAFCNILHSIEDFIVRSHTAKKNCQFQHQVTAVLLVLLVSSVDAADDWATIRSTFIANHCAGCHGGQPSQGGLDLGHLNFDLEDSESLEKWVRVYDRVVSGEMPPKSEARASPDETRRFLGPLADLLFRADFVKRTSVLRRLNRIEYENTICDLFGIRVSLKDSLPEDSTVYGFDTIGEALSISPQQMELYLRAADQAIAQVFGADRAPPKVAARMPLGLDPFASREIGGIFMKTEDDSLITFQGMYCPTQFLSGKALVDGTYRVQIKAKVYQSKSPLVMAVYGGDVLVGRGPVHLVGYYDIEASDEWTIVSFDDFLQEGDCYHAKPYRLIAPTQGDNRFNGPGLMIGEMSVEGPLEAWPPVSRKSLLGSVMPQSAGIDEAREILTRLLPRAFRRRTSQDEVEPFLALVKSALDSKRPFLESLSIGLKAVLCSSEFLMREEQTITSPKDGRVVISEESLASRLSYFLWSSMPDDELLAKATSETLSHPDELRAQVERMLNDPKSERFVENFTGQWLGLRNINFTEPDAKLYPEFDELLRYSIVEETHLYFREILDHNRSLLEFIDSDWAMLNERMAIHYQLKGLKGQAFQRVSLPKDSVRGGLLTQASIMKVTANGTTTSPVVRGSWVLNNILGQPSPPPPPNVPAIEPDIRGAATVRELLQKHRNIQSCAVCHNRIDPPGLALECFDAIGGWRKDYRTLSAGKVVDLEIDRKRVEFRIGKPVKTNGILADGRKFNDIRDLKKILMEDKKQLARNLAEKLFVYAVGRNVGFSDRTAIMKIVANVEKQNYGFRTLIHEVIQSPLFRKK